MRIGIRYLRQKGPIMGRSTEQSYKVVAQYLQDRRLPATVNDIISANIISRATAYKLFRPELFTDAALYGIKPLNDTKPFFFTYDANLQLEVLGKFDKSAADLIANHKDVLVGAANKVAANAVVLDDINSAIIRAANEFREKYDKDDTLRANFKQPSYSVAGYLNTMIEIREVLEADPLKFKSYILSTFVTMQNGD